MCQNKQKSQNLKVKKMISIKIKSQSTAENSFWQLFDIIWLIFLVSQINTILPLQIYSYKMYTPKRLVPRIRVTKFIHFRQRKTWPFSSENKKWKRHHPSEKINLLCIHIWPSLPSLVSPSKPLEGNRSIYHSICINR